VLPLIAEASLFYGSNGCVAENTIDAFVVMLCNFS